MSRRDDLPLFPVPEWRAVYDHLKAAEGHIRDAQELLRARQRQTPRLWRMQGELEDMLHALRAAPPPRPPERQGSDGWAGPYRRT